MAACNSRRMRSKVVPSGGGAGGGGGLGFSDMREHVTCALSRLEELSSCLTNGGMF